MGDLRRQLPAGVTRALRTALAIVLASVAAAGLLVSTSSDLDGLTPFPIDDALLLPGLVLIGLLLGLAIGDAGRSAVALVIAGTLGTLLYAAAVAAPGREVPGVRTTLIDRATSYGLLALMLIVLFGLIGVVLSWLLGGDG